MPIPSNRQRVRSYLYQFFRLLILSPFSTRLFTNLAITTLATLFLLFLPWLPPFSSSRSSILDPITRIFPFNRGLFEDKVSNFWCASNVVFKWRERMGRDALVRSSAGLTAVGFVPAVWGLIFGGWKMRSRGPVTNTSAQHVSTPTPTLPLLPYALLTSSLSFFLFSFQVHEKSILVPLLPATVLLSGAAVGSTAHEWGVLLNNIGMFRCVSFSLFLFSSQRLTYRVVCGRC